MRRDSSTCLPVLVDVYQMVVQELLSLAEFAAISPDMPPGQLRTILLYEVRLQWTATDQPQLSRRD